MPQMDRASTSNGDPASPKLPQALADNIHELYVRHRGEERERPLHVRMADFITRFSGSMAFIGLHLLWFVPWILLNVGLLGREGFDPFPFGLLTTIVSLEAIFLTAFVLLSQNRMQVVADRRAELDLHINLLAEREATVILAKLARIEARLGITVPEPEARMTTELAQPTDAASILDGIERAQREERELQTKR